MAPINSFTQTVDNMASSVHHSTFSSVAFYVAMGIIAVFFVALFSYIFYRLGSLVVFFTSKLSSNSVKSTSTNNHSPKKLPLPVMTNIRQPPSSNWKSFVKSFSEFFTHKSDRDPYPGLAQVPESSKWARTYLISFRGTDDVTVPMPCVDLGLPSPHTPPTIVITKTASSDAPSFQDADAVMKSSSLSTANKSEFNGKSTQDREKVYSKDLDIGEAIGMYLLQDSSSVDSLDDNLQVLTPPPIAAAWGSPRIQSFDFSIQGQGYGVPVYDQHNLRSFKTFSTMDRGVASYYYYNHHLIR